MQKWRFKLNFEADEVIIDPRVTRLRLLGGNGWAADKRMSWRGSLSAYPFAIRCCQSRAFACPEAGVLLFSQIVVAVGHNNGYFDRLSTGSE